MRSVMANQNENASPGKKRLKGAFALFFLVSAFLPLIFWIVGIDSPRFVSEARPKLPQIMIDGSFNEDAATEFDAYWSKSFPLNSWLVSRYNYLTGHLAASSTNPQVIWGRDGYLFFRETLNDMLKVPSISDLELARIHTSLTLQAAFVKNAGSTFHVMPAPNKASIYPDRLPFAIRPVSALSNAERLLQTVGDLPLIDLFAPLRTLAEDSPVTIYHRLDSHWNNVGAMEAYRAIMRAVQMDPLPLSEPFRETLDFQGDLATMYYPDRVTLDVNYEPQDFEPRYVSLRPLRTLEDITIETRQRERTGSLLMFRDSFANALIPYISASVGDVTYLRQDRPDYRLVKEIKPDAVILEIAERNLDWWLQATPIMPAPAVAEPDAADAIDLTIQVESREAFGFYHTQVRLDTLPYPFTRVIVAASDGAYEAFPVYEDDAVDDRTVIPGFSLYTETRLDDVRIYLFAKNGWIRLN